MDEFVWGAFLWPFGGLGRVANCSLGLSPGLLDESSISGLQKCMHNLWVRSLTNIKVVSVLFVAVRCCLDFLLL